MDDRRMADWIQRFNSRVNPKYQLTTAAHTHVEAKEANGGMTNPAPSKAALATASFKGKRMKVGLFRQLFDYHPYGSCGSQDPT